MSGGGSLGRYRRALVLVPAGAVVALVIFVGVGPPALFLKRVTVCELGPEVGTYVIWTPEELLNKPDLTNVSAYMDFGSWGYTFTSGSLTVGAIPSESTGGGGGGEADHAPGGGISGDYQNHNWTIYQATNESVVGSTPGPCTQPYIAEIGQPQGCGGSARIPLLPNNSTDTNEPHIWNGTTGVNGSEPGCPVQTPGAFVWFDTSFHSDGTGSSVPVTWNLCNRPGDSLLQLTAPAQIPIVVTVPYDGHDISSTGFEVWQGDPNGGTVGGDNPTFYADSASYSLPGGWNWTLAPVGPAQFQINPYLPLPSLVAFVQHSC